MVYFFFNCSLFVLQNALGTLGASAIQTFLDELTFREVYGHYPLAAFNSLIQRLKTQTAHVVKKGSNMVSHAKVIAGAPFEDYRLTRRHPDVSRRSSFKVKSDEENILTIE